MLVATCVPAGADGPTLPSIPAAVTSHRIVSPEHQLLRYTVSAEQTPIDVRPGEQGATMFSVAYSLVGSSASTRPVAFLWNGGPGSSSVWLHMGSFGPWRVELNGTGAVVPPPHLVVNDGMLLDTTDLVFVDAPGTGYSRIGDKGRPEDFYGVDQDARAFTQFIERWLTAHGRWNSPKFLIGESYGTTRAANVVDRLQLDGVGINGVVLISSALDLEALDPALPGDEMSNVAFLPSETAVAWVHHALPEPAGSQPLEPLLERARAFAGGPYASALLRGDTLDDATRRSIAEQLHAFTGLDERYIERANLRIDPTRFEKELLRDQGRITGRLDGRFSGYDLDANADSPAYDPADSTISDAFVSAFNAYVHGELRLATAERYLPEGEDIENRWDVRRQAADVGLAGVHLPNVLPDLAQALTRSPSLRVFSANGYFDLATPFFGTETALHALGLNPALRSHVTLGYYQSGHMIYLESASRRALRRDIEDFMRSAMRS